MPESAPAWGGNTVSGPVCDRDRATLALVSVASDKVRAEMALFRAALPRLLQELPGRWVVFRDGQVQSVHDDESAAFSEGLRRFGREGGHIVAQVAEERVVPLHAGVVFGIR